MAPYSMVVILFLIADRLFKILALNDIFSPPINLLDQIFKLAFSRNYYLAFSLPFNPGWAVILIIIIIVALLYYFIRLLYSNSFIKAGILFFIIFGATSNLYDRLKYGFVIDYLDLKYFTVFNLADIMIVMGVAGLFYLTLNKKDDRNKGRF